MLVLRIIQVSKGDPGVKGRLSKLYNFRKIVQQRWYAVTPFNGILYLSKVFSHLVTINRLLCIQINGAISITVTEIRQARYAYKALMINEIRIEVWGAIIHAPILTAL